ncbi:MAG: hypothetical protein EXQ70_05935 [Solirubrobacterales bacterium]|nr:hypothetical protein [Solirubrobacterales bacterium]
MQRCSHCRGAALATFPGANGQIEISSGRGVGGDAQANIYTFDNFFDLTLDGPKDLIAGQHRHANWSADGRFLTFTIRPGAAGTDDVFVRDNELGSTVILGFGSSPGVLEDHPTFSPDGSQIAYESEVTDGSLQEDILVGPADGTGTTFNLTNGPGAGDDAFVEQTPVWSPDGQFIYYARKLNNAATDLDIYREPANDTGAPSLIVDAFTAIPEFQPEISPDGTKLCVTRGAFGSAAADIMVLNVDGSGAPFEESAPEPPGPDVADYDCAWSPDGKTIGWTHGAFGAGDLIFAASDGSGPKTPYGNNSAFFDGNLDWSRAQNKCNGKLVTILGTTGPDTLTGTEGTMSPCSRTAMTTSPASAVMTTSAPVPATTSCAAAMATTRSSPSPVTTGSRVAAAPTSCAEGTTTTPSTETKARIACLARAAGTRSTAAPRGTSATVARGRTRPRAARSARPSKTSTFHTALGMSKQNVDRFVELVDAFNRSDIAAVVRSLDPEIQFEHRIPALQGKYVGVDGMRDFFADFAVHFDSSHIDCPDVRDLGDRMLALGTPHVTGKGSGAETEPPCTVVASFDQSRVTHFIDFGDKAEALEAAGLSE